MRKLFWEFYYGLIITPWDSTSVLYLYSHFKIAMCIGKNLHKETPWNSYLKTKNRASVLSVLDTDQILYRL